MITRVERLLRVLLAGVGMLAAADLIELATRPAGVASQEASGDYQALRGDLATELLLELESFVEWCGKKKLYASRATACEAILAFDPDHAQARRLLGFRRKKGVWEAPRRPRSVKDFPSSALEELEERREATVGVFIDRAMAYYAKNKDSLSPEDVELLFGDVLSLNPDHLEVRTLRREVRDETGTWVLAETAVGATRREELAEILRSIGSGIASPENVEPDINESSMGLEWSYSLATPLVRVHGTGDREEGLHAARTLSTAGTFFNQVFGVDARMGSYFTVYLLAQRDQRSAILDNHVAIDAGFKKYLLQLDGSGIPGTDDFVHWASTRERRLDATVRYAIGLLLLDGFGIGTELGWAYEGMGQYLTNKLIGTRMTWFLMQGALSSSRDVALRSRLTYANADWMAEGAALFGNEDRPTLAELLNKPVAKLSTEELLIGYVFAAYLLEGAPDRATGFLRLVGRRKVPGEEAIRVTFGLSVEQLEQRLERWLEERGSFEGD